MKIESIQWSNLTPLCPALLGMALVLYGNLPRTAGLSGLAFIQASEAKGDQMLWLLLGMAIAMAGLLVGTYRWRSWTGKCGLFLSAFALVWPYLCP